MRGSDFARTLPDGKTAGSLAEREARIVEAVTRGDCVHPWTTLELEDGGHRALVAVSSDTLRIGEPGDSIRVSLSARAQLQACQFMAGRLLTPKLVDLIWKRAVVRLAPLTRAWYQDGSMAWTERMLQQGAALDARVHDTGADSEALVANAGKDWVAIRSLAKGRSANYGWLGTGSDKSVTGEKIIQSVGTAHDDKHVDYSQLPRFVSHAAVLDGKACDIDDILTHPTACKLITHDGPLSLVEVPDTIPAPPPKRSSSSLNMAILIGDETGVPYIKARNFTIANRSKVDVVVIHSMEAAEKPGTALAVAKWFGGPNAPMASAHWCVDGGEVDSLVQCVLEKHVAYHAPGANGNGIGIEHAGYAKQTEAQWVDAYGLNMLQRSAELAARICKRWNIPPVRLTREELKAGRRGFVGHVDVSLTFKKSTHTDPGNGFPWGRYMAMVAKELEALK